MNHDACHCFNWDPAICPDTCYRAQLTKDLKETNYPYPVTWSWLKNTPYCPKWPEKTEEPK